MKSSFLVHIVLPDVFTEKLYSLLPAQRDFVNRLMEERSILTYSLDMGRKNIWAIFELGSEKALRSILRRQPIAPFVSYTIHELAFHDAAPIDLPELILN